MKRIRVAIDGPAGAGKSTVSREVADRLGYLLLDTGALYRTVALAATRAEVSFDDAPAVAAVAERLVARSMISLSRGDAGMLVALGGEDVSLAIRAPEMSLGASRVSAIPAVRAALLEMQRSAAREGGVVLEGRDIGTVVMPDAEAKFFLTASPEVRAQRRVDELRARGTDVSYERTLDEVVQRDRADTERPVAPLRRADDAILIDSSVRSADEVVAEIVAAVQRIAVG
jgi:cytidylate kinase